MTAAHRWAVVALGVALLVGVPLAWRAIPPADAEVDAAALLERIREADGASWSGYVETNGRLQVPSVDEFGGVASLLGERTRLRVWWGDDDAWRVDRLLVSGETDLVHEDGTTTEWSYERAGAEVSRDPDIRLPRTVDLLPTRLAERVLRGADADDVERLPSRRVAGVAAPGLRLVPPQEQSSIDHVDLWADPGTGVPLRVEVHADADARPEVVAAFSDFSPGRPDAEVLAFTPTATTDVSREDVLDIADAANQYAPLRPPDEVAGLARSGASDGAVGVYGSGAAQLVAIPLRSREADALREQVRVTPGSALVEEPVATTIALAPLGLIVTGDDGEGAWLVAGTVTDDTLVEAARDLLTRTVVVRR